MKVNNIIDEHRPFTERSITPTLDWFSRFGEKVLLHSCGIYVSMMVNEDKRGVKSQVIFTSISVHPISHLQRSM